MKNAHNRSVIFLVIASFCLLNTADAQKQKLVISNKHKNQDDNLNKRDAKSHKQGMWFFDKPIHFGDPGYYEFGAYKDDMKSGLWYKLTKDQQLIAIEHFNLNVLDGPAQYFENGKLATVGNYRGIFTPYANDTFIVTDPVTFADSTVIIPAERGYTKHGTWRYYDPASGHLIMEREYQVDIVLKEKRFELPLPKSNGSKLPTRLPHEGGKDKGWNTGKGKSRNSLIK